MIPMRDLSDCDEAAPGTVLTEVAADGQIDRIGLGFGQELDPQVLARARRGDMQAHASIYRVYGRACYNLALRILGEPAAAEDVVQDVFLRMMDRIGGFRGDAPFGAWLKRMTANATIDAVRHNRRYGNADAEAVIDAVASGGRDEALVDAWSLLVRLPARARAIVVLHQLEGYTHTELAQLFGQSESYSKSILARALKRLHGLADPGAEEA